MSSSERLAEQLLAWFVPAESYVVALSGGVDSAVVAAACKLSGVDGLAVTARSASVAGIELRDAQRLAQTLELEHHWIDPGETNEPAYQANDLRRCYYCKSQLYSTIAAQFPGRTILSGTNHDDLGDYRPGLEAAAKAHVQSPLACLQLTKADVRSLAKLWQLDIADKPASPCLASRIAYGVSVTPERLSRVERAEQYLRELGLVEFRVRLHADEVARIEVAPEHIAQLAAESTRSALVATFEQLGFRYVTLDLVGFRSGSLNPVFQIAATPHSPHKFLGITM